MASHQDRGRQDPGDREKRPTGSSAKGSASPSTLAGQAGIAPGGLDPRFIQPATVLRLQRAVGNQAVQRLLAQRTPVQRHDLSEDDEKQVLQRKLEFTGGTEFLDAEKNPIGFRAYKAVQKTARELPKQITVGTGDPGAASAKYRPGPDRDEGGIMVRGLDPTQISEKAGAYNASLATFTHETQHAIDDLGGAVAFRGSANKVNKMHTEWRAWAMEAATVYEMTIKRDERFPRGIGAATLPYAYKDKKSFAAPESQGFIRTKLYLQEYEIQTNPTDRDVLDFIRAHDDWLTEAIRLFYDNVEGGIGGAEWPGESSTSEGTSTAGAMEEVD